MILLATLLGGLAMAGVAQNPSETTGTKKSDSEKSTEPVKGKEVLKAPKLPPGAIIVVPKDFEKGLPSWPGFAVVPLEEYLKLLKEAAEKRPAKTDQTRASVCEMSGRLEGNYVTLRGEFTFATELPKMTVLLGLKGAQLTEKGDLDGQAPVMDYNDKDGFTVRVEEAASQHRLVLSFRVPVLSKQPAGSSGVERSLELGLPGTVTTTLALELPPAVKEVRGNSTLEKHPVQGKWFFALGKQEKVTVSWREPLPQPGGGAHLSAEGKIKVELRDAFAEINVQLVLLDPRGQTKECQLMLPAQAEVKVEPPPGVPYELLAPGPKAAYHVLRFTEPNTERWTVTALVRVPRPAPGGRLAVGPFYVQGADQQHGTIAVVAPTELVRKQRLVYYRSPEVFQRDPPPGQAVEALFEYWGLPNPAKVKPPAARLPLEVEVRSERGPLQASVDQVLKLRPGGESWEIDLTAQIEVKSPLSGGDFIELLLPQPRPVGAALFATAPATPFPSALPWPALGLIRGPLVSWAQPLEFQISDGGGMSEVPVPDGRGHCQVRLPGGLGKTFTLTLTGKYAVLPQGRRVRVGLPRLIGLSGQVSKVAVETEEAFELLLGPPSKETPVQEKHRYQFPPATEAPSYVDVAWRPFIPEFPVESTIDVVVQGRSAQVRQRLTFAQAPRPTPAQLPRVGQVELKVPDAVVGLKQVRGGKLFDLSPEKWVTPGGEDPKEIVLEYGLLLSRDPAGDAAAPRSRLALDTVWPQGATRKGALLRVWCDPGTRVERTGLDIPGEMWQDRGVEPVTGHDRLPALVLRGDGTRLPLTLAMDELPESGVAPLVCERGLIQATLEEDGSVLCRARYLVGKINGDKVEVRFPLRVAQCLLEVRLDGHGVTWTPVEGADKVAIVPLRGTTGEGPVMLELQYRLSPTTQEGRLFGTMTLYPPMFGGPVRVGRLRWQVNLPRETVAAPITPGARLEYRWTLNPLLFPEPATSSAELEAWLQGNGAGGAAGDGSPVSLLFTPAGSDVQRVLYQSWRRWLVLVSGSFLALFFFAFFLRGSRITLLVLLGLLGLTSLLLALICPAVLPALFYGAQPVLPIMFLVLLIHGLQHQRSRWQLVFIPSFTRVKGGSSLLRTAKSSNRPREASTIDAPPPSGVAGPASSVAKK
jgi:hypothetical protein